MSLPSHTELFGVGDKFEELVVEELLYMEFYTLVQGDQQKISLEMMLMFIVCKSVQRSHVKHDFKLWVYTTITRGDRNLLSLPSWSVGSSVMLCDFTSALFRKLKMRSDSNSFPLLKKCLGEKSLHPTYLLLAFKKLPTQLVV